MRAYTPQEVSVVICAYTENRWGDLIAAVSSVQRQTAPPGEIIVVIDHNGRLLERVSQQLPCVVATENREAPGAAGARNSGVAISRGAIVAFLDDDAEAEPEWIEALLRGYERDHALGVGGELQPVWLGGRPRWFPEEFDWVVGCSYRGMPEGQAPVRNLIAANMSVHKEIFTAIGGFRSGFGNVRSRERVGASLLRSCAGDEETDLCIRAGRWWPEKVWLYEPRAHVRHKVPTARARWRYFLSRCYDEGVGKARLTSLLGRKEPLRSERSYTLRVLPAGVVRGIVETVVQRDLSGLMRSGAIVAGLTVTVVGYVVGRMVAILSNTRSVAEESSVTLS